MSEEMQQTPEPGTAESMLIRIVVVAILLALAVIVIAIVGLLILQSSRQGPIALDVYPGAQIFNVLNQAPGIDYVLYSTSDDPHDVAAFYDERMEDCQEVQAPLNEDGSLVNPEDPPYRIVCSLDNSVPGVMQVATVIINPGVGEEANITWFTIKKEWM